jgi:hypothetical protein
MNRHSPSCSCGRYAPPALTRREALRRFAGGIGALALSSLFAGRTAAGVSGGSFDLLPKVPQFAARAKRVIMLYMGGGPSQMDLLDPKPVLQKNDGQPMPGSVTQRRWTARTS